jgi:hypothetical protein
MVNIKAQGLLNAVKWIEQNHGQQKLATIIQACSPAVRERYMSAIGIEWHPMEEFCELLEVSERVLGDRPGEVSRKIGTIGAKQNTRGLVKRGVFYVASPDFLLRRISSLWSQFNDKGSMRVLHVDDKYALLEVEGVPNPHALFCATLTGWTEVISEAVGLVNARVEHDHCRARGSTQCTWRITWNALVGT